MSSRAMDEALRVLSRRRVTVARMRDHLERKGFSAEEILECLGRLEEWGYLDDRSYAQDWVEKVVTEAPMGRARMLLELQARGVPPDIAEETVSQVFTVTSEKELAERAAREYLVRAANSPSRSGRKRATNLAKYLLRRGFDDELVFLVISELNSDLEFPEVTDSDA
ncbi:MAG: RecX family transcriptional regulator [Firmicutes bacterium]|nr:RecX family transcriptional regulator [Candidatus Fermentithermobacillaceae bacterium]